MFVDTRGQKLIKNTDIKKFENADMDIKNADMDKKIVKQIHENVLKRTI